MKQLTRQQGLQLEALGSILIVTVMLTDRFLFGVQDGFILACAVVSAILLIIGIRTVKYWDDQQQELDSMQKAEQMRQLLNKNKK